MKTTAGVIVIVILSGITTFIWFRQGLMFAGGEEGLPFYNLTRYLTLISYIWHDSGTGFPVSAFLPGIPYFYLLEKLFRLGVNSIYLQALTFFILIFTGCISIFFLVKETIQNQLKKNVFRTAPILAGIFYLLNPFSMTQVWGRGLFPQFFSFALVPLFLLLFILGIKRKNFLYGLWLVLVSLFFSPAFVSPSQILVLWTPILVYLSFFVLTNKENKKAIFFAVSFFFLVILFWFLTHAWWIIPNFKVGEQTYSQYLNQSELNLGTLRGVSRQYPLPAVIRLMHNGYFFQAKYYGEVYSNFGFTILSWFIPIISLFAMPVFKKSPHFRFYLALFFLSLFFSLGSNPPLGWLFEFFFKNIPYLTAFRNPFEKFGLVLLVAYIPFFAYGTVGISEILTNYFKRPFIYSLIQGTILFLVCGLFVWPMWAGVFAGGFKVNSWVEVPGYYKEANRWLADQFGNFRSLHLPLMPGDGIKYNWPHYYQGVVPTDYLFTHSSIARNTFHNKAYYNILLERFGRLEKGILGTDPDITNSEFRSEKFYQELARLNVRYIIFHKDIDHGQEVDITKKTMQYLARQEKIEKVKTFGQLDIYQVDIPANIDLIYSPDTKITFKKINPTIYSANIHGATKPFDLLFLELFDTGWEALIDGKKIEDHQTVFSYANAWKIDKRGDYTVILKYQPQELVNQGMRASAISILGILVLLIGYRLWKVKKF